MKPRPLVLALVGLSLAAATPAESGERQPPKHDAARAIRESANFRKGQEPEMTEDEYALYEKAVAMTAVQPEFALKLLETMVADQQKSPAFELVLGNLYYANNRPDLAEMHYRKATERYPDFIRAWSNLGSLYYGQARYAEAATCLTKTIAAGDRDAHTLGLLAYCLEQTGRRTAAEMDYLQALGLDPDNPDYLDGLVTLYYDAKQYARAEPLLAQLLRIKPQEARNWLVYSKVLSSLDRPIDAIVTLETARSLGLLGADGLVALGELYTKQKLNREAAETFGQLVAQSPDIGTDCLIAYAQALIGEGRYDDAELSLSRLPGTLPAKKQVQCLQIRADLSVSREDWPDARRQFESLLQLDPLNGRALLGLGRIYKVQDDVARANVVLESAARQPGVAAQACLELADLALKSRQYERGLNYLQQAAKLDSSPPLQQYIAKVKLLTIDNESAPTPR